MNPAPAHNVEAERALIGAALLTGELNPPDFPAEAFHVERHAWIWRACQTLRSEGQVINTVTVGHVLDGQGRLDEAGNYSYIGECMNYCDSIAYAESYAGVVLTEWTKRKAEHLMREAYKRVMSANGNLPEVLSDFSAGLDALTPRSALGHTSLSGAAYEWTEQVIAWIETGQLPGITTGYRILDRDTHGIKRGELTILAGRPSMGKSALAFQMARRQACAGYRVGIFAHEMNRASVAERIILADLNLDKFRLTSADIPLLVHARNELENLPLQICDASGLSVGEMQREAREMARTMGGLDVVYVDNLSYVAHPAGDNENVRIGRTTKLMTRWAREMDCGLVCIVHLSRAVTERAVKEPELQDLRESGHIEQDGRMVLMVHRPEYYLPLDQRTPKNKPQKALVIVRKNHNGPAGIAVPMAFVEQSAQFAEWAPTPGRA